MGFRSSKSTPSSIPTPWDSGHISIPIFRSSARLYKLPVLLHVSTDSLDSRLSYRLPGLQIIISTQKASDYLSISLGFTSSIPTPFSLDCLYRIPGLQIVYIDSQVFGSSTLTPSVFSTSLQTSWAFRLSIPTTWASNRLYPLPVLQIIYTSSLGFRSSIRTPISWISGSPIQSPWAFISSIQTHWAFTLSILTDWASDRLYLLPRLQIVYWMDPWTFGSSIQIPCAFRLSIQTPRTLGRLY